MAHTETGEDVGITVRRFGPRAGRLPLIALPGLNDGLAPLRVAPPPAPPASFADDHVVVVSFPDPVPAGATTRSLARDLGSYLAREVGPCIVSGHSMGAMVALHLAADRPDLVRGLALGAAVARADEHVIEVLARWEAALTDGRFLDFHRDATTVAYTGTERVDRLASLEASPPPPPTADLVVRHVNLSRAARTHDARPRLGDVTAPTLVLAGEHDPLAHADRSRELADALPDARFVLLDGVAHGFPEQAPSRYTAVLDGFVHDELMAGETA